MYNIRILWYNIRMNEKNIADDYLSSVNLGLFLKELLPCFTDVVFYVKNRQKEFIFGNQALVELCGAKDLREILGKTDYDFFPYDLATDYQREDEQVMRSGNRIVCQPWVVCDVTGKMNWYLSSKIPLFGAGADNSSAETPPTIGIAGILGSHQPFKQKYNPYIDLKDVVAFILENYRSKLPIDELADLTLLSVSQFERRFKTAFHTTPQQFITNVRLRAAARLLISSDFGLAQIAHDTGFFDQSHLTRTFKKAYQTTPSDYRKEKGNSS